MNRMLIISGDMVRSGESLRRRVLRFTGSRTATRRIVNRIDDARRMGHVMSCMVLPRVESARGAAAPLIGDEHDWDVRVSYATAAVRRGGYA